MKRRLWLALLAAGTAPAAAQAKPGGLGFEVAEAGLVEIQRALADGRVTSVQLVDAYLARIAAFDLRGPALNAILHLNPGARAEAAALDRERARSGPRGPLHGIPVLIKDNFDTTDQPTTGGSVALASFTPPDDAFQVRKLRAAGAILLGKTNMHELALGITTTSSLGGQTRNPYDPLRNPGGSSGGTAAAVAASYAAIGWGTDTCGSLRVPAAHNSLWTLRVTKGLSSVSGIIPLCHTQDVAGPLARSATDLAIGLDATIGRDSADPATAALDSVALPRFVAALDSSALKGARLGILRSVFGGSGDPQEVGPVVEAAIARMVAAGATAIEVEVPGLDSLLKGSSVIGFEGKTDLAGYLTARHAPVASLADILKHGLYLASMQSTYDSLNSAATGDTAAFQAALARRRLLREALVATLTRNHLDALVYPTIRREAALIGDSQQGNNCSLSANSGLPALSAPAGFTANRMPAGMELLGAPFSDARLLALGFAYERAVQPRQPPILTPPLSRRGAGATLHFTASAAGEGILARFSFTFDRPTAVLRYSVYVTGTAAPRVLAINLNIGPRDALGPVVRRLARPGVTRDSGVVVLSTIEHRALQDGRLYVSVLTPARPLGALRAQLALPPAER